MYIYIGLPNLLTYTSPDLYVPNACNGASVRLSKMSRARLPVPSLLFKLVTSILLPSPIHAQCTYTNKKKKKRKEKKNFEQIKFL